MGNIFQNIVFDTRLFNEAVSVGKVTSITSDAMEQWLFTKSK